MTYGRVIQWQVAVSIERNGPAMFVCHWVQHVPAARQAIRQCSWMA